ncbi:MAG: aminotransferase class III-fold pyridoxal phosphate-dependent enzyme, partial [Deltaproteobacteria bacterium]|nr:aminotransferase class III-fold pyridoxal phosphate-dependent enzyme [Deltaproteobacteria bacterium]
MPDRAIAIIQARMSSSRLSGKVLEKICGKEMLWHVVNRLRSAEMLSDMVIATSIDPSDDIIEKMCAAWGVKCHRGSLADVLDRYYGAALTYGAKTIVRITADCPLIDPLIVDKAVKRFFENHLDHVGLENGFPDGLDTEVFSFEALERAWKEAKLPSEREHVTPYIWKNKDLFKLGSVQSGADMSHMRWTVDVESDLRFVTAVYEAIGSEGGMFHADDVIRLLKERPWLMDINKGVVRNEGYLKSLDEDKKAICNTAGRKLEMSEVLWKRAKELIPAGTQTLSKAPDQFVRGVTPKYLKRGKGSHVWDVDGNEYIDYPMALGPILLGYDYPTVVEAVVKQLHEGTTFTLMHPLEVEVAELLNEIIPCADMARFAKNGADATSAAVKVARSATGREHVAYSGYHGCQDWFAITMPRTKGIPKALAGLMHPFEFNDIESLRKVFEEHPYKISAVILEVGGKDPC